MMEPLNVYDFHDAMKKKLLLAESKKDIDIDAYTFYVTGVLDEYTLRENEKIFKSVWLRPRILIGVPQKQFVNTNVSLFGGKTACALPIYISATTRSNLAHKQAEIAIIKAARNKNIIYMLPSLSSIPFKQVIEAKGDQSIWYQLYTMNPQFVRHKKYVENKLDLAIGEGLKTIVLTVDSPSYSKRERYLKETCNEWMVNIQPPVLNPSLNWSFVQWIVNNYCKKYDVRLLLKGVGCAEDVLKAYHVDYISGVILGNHGGRQGEYFRSSIEVLIETTALFDQNNINLRNDDSFDIFVDGGFRRGTDVFKALSLGASAVGIGRPVIYGLACEGQEGVEKIIDIFKNELILCMQLMGVENIQQIKRNMVCYKTNTFHSGFVRTHSHFPKL